MTFLALFMKSPTSGTVKRRLRSVLSEEAVARLYEAFVQDLLEKLSVFPCDRKVIAYFGEPTGLIQASHSFSLYAQSGRDLGKRLLDYFQWSFSEGATKSIVIGSDSPTLPLAYLEEAFQLLDRHETVLGPSEDGGYYLIGMRHLNPALFSGIPWGSGEVFAETLKRIHPAEDLGMLGRWYDVDTPVDLKRLRGHLREMAERKETGLPFRTHQVLSELVF